MAVLPAEIFHAVVEHLPQKGSGRGGGDPPRSLQHGVVVDAPADEAGSAGERGDNKRGDSLLSSLHHPQFPMCQCNS